MRRAEDIRDALHRATDQLNEEILATEKSIATLGYGVRVSIETDLGGTLSFTKLGGSWRLAYEKDGAVNPLVQQSRAHRISLVAHIPDLVAALPEAAKAQAQEVRAARLKLRETRLEVEKLALHREAE